MSKNRSTNSFKPVLPNIYLAWWADRLPVCLPRLQPKRHHPRSLAMLFPSVNNNPPVIGSSSLANTPVFANDPFVTGSGKYCVSTADWIITLGLIVKVQSCENSPLRYSGETHVMFFLALAVSIAFFGWKEHKYFHPADRECLSTPALVMGAYTCLNDLNEVSSPRHSSLRFLACSIIGSHPVLNSPNQRYRLIFAAQTSLR